MSKRATAKTELLPFPAIALIDQHGFTRPMAGRSPRWPAVERAHLKKEPFCRVCTCKEGLQVHHKQPFHLFPELELVEANLITLCAPHHLLVGHLMLWASWNKDCEKDADAWFRKCKDRPH